MQIGNATLSKTEYQAKLNAAKLTYPGALIFGTYYDDVKVKAVQEIWANGTQYSVGAGSDARFYTGEAKPEDYFSPTGEGKDIHPQHGDYYIQTADLTPHTTGDDITWRKAFVYDSLIKDNTGTVVGGWVALSGNYSAQNIYFPEGIKRNQGWGQKGPESTSVTECVGMNLSDVMRFYLLVSGDVEDPTYAENTVSDPSIVVSSSDAVSFVVKDAATDGNVVTSGSWHEVGTKLYIQANSDVKYEGYNLTATTETHTLTQGGATITTSKYGYWENEEDAGKGDASIAKMQKESLLR